LPDSLSGQSLDSIIVFVRGVPVLLDKDLAKLYGIETKALNQAVKRNLQRFPEDFMFQLTKEECLRSQIVTSKGRGGTRYLPYAFTENGIAMLSSVLHSDIAIEVNIRIMRAFTKMRQLIANQRVFVRLDAIEQHQQETDKRVDEVFQLIERKELIPNQGIFFDGQVYDAFEFVSKLIKDAEKGIILIDNYISDEVLTLLERRGNGVKASIYTQKIDHQLALSLKKFNAQYPAIEVKTFKFSHDRFLCIDNVVYHIGASIKDLGKKWFAFSILYDVHPDDLVKRIEQSCEKG
jgi:hypothetical protein